MIKGSNKNQIEVPREYIWNCMIKSYFNNTNPDEEWGYSSDLFTFPFVLKSCSVCANPTIENYGCGIDFLIQANHYVLF